MEPRAVTLTPVHRHPSSWRRTIGALLRAAREERALRLVDVAARARLSPQYLSEVERGRKEPSSEVLAALTDALGLTLVDLAHGIATALDADARTTRDRAPSWTDRDHGARDDARRTFDRQPLDDRRDVQPGALVLHGAVVDATASAPFGDARSGAASFGDASLRDLHVVLTGGPTLDVLGGAGPAAPAAAVLLAA
ncbi:helix-turn-helix domain-containing protein [Cellulomonas iranensis]|uniref:helix-turn-helix domain-containing protein n=1 Tax=Cellulomonas iranensis TaxID=76862 RepID=UPI000B3C985A|nr:helix-turn-helix transcriptional regulator [Cellulomonas iranensis]